MFIFSLPAVVLISECSSWIDFSCKSNLLSNDALTSSIRSSSGLVSTGGATFVNYAFLIYNAVSALISLSIWIFAVPCHKDWWLGRFCFDGLKRPLFVGFLFWKICTTFVCEDCRILWSSGCLSVAIFRVWKIFCFVWIKVFEFLSSHFGPWRLRRFDSVSEFL